MSLKRIGTAAWVAVVLSGCAYDNEPVATSTPSAGELQRELRDRNSQIETLENRLANRDSQIDQLRSELSNQPDTPVGSAGDELFPPNAQPGECYARVLYPEQFRSWEERVLVREASERYEVIPAEYETVQERVLVKEASTRLEVVPATYKEIQERVLVKAESTRVIEVPATYKAVTETVLDKPAHTVWKKGSPESLGGSVLSETVNATGELMCLVEVPATYKTVTRTVVDTPAHTREETIPAEYKTVTRRVVDTPATTREVEIPAVYDTVSVTKLARAADSRKVAIPEEYRTITKREKTSEARMEWQQVLCSINATSDNVRQLQAALDERGFNPGSVDGVLGPDTIVAVNRYAKSVGIPQGANYVPLEVIERLGLTL